MEHLSVARIGTVEDAGQQLWDEVADPGDLYQSRAWLRALESTDDAALTYLIARRPGESRILGALPLFAPPGTRGDHVYWPELHFQDLLRGEALRGDRLGLLAGASAGFRTRLILDRSLPDTTRRDVVRALLDAAGAEAADRGLAYVFFLFTDAATSRDLAGNARLADAAQTELELPGAGFDDYVASLAKNVRTAVRRETSVYRTACTTEVVPLGAAVPEIAPLIAEVRAKHGMAHTAEAAERRLRTCHRALGDDRAGAIVCRAGDERILGASVVCHYRDTLYVTDFGRRDGTTPDPFVYFNATVYEPIRYAYARGVRRIVTGAGAERGKARRGATLLPLFHVAVPAAGLAQPEPTGDSRDAERRSRWRAERSAHPRYFDPVWDELL